MRRRQCDQNWVGSRRQWPEFGCEQTSVWPEFGCEQTSVWPEFGCEQTSVLVILTSTHSQILVTDISLQPNSGHWHILASKFWSLTSAANPILVTLTSSQRHVLRGFELFKLIWSWKRLQLLFKNPFPCSGGKYLWYINFFLTTVGSL